MSNSDVHTARKRFGQHFLVDSFVIDEIIALIDPEPRDRILEIGPGGGALTEQLVASGAEVVVVEIDRDLSARLEARYAGAANITVVGSDILTFDLDRLPNPDCLWKLAGNLPYNISTALIQRLLNHAARFSSMVLMLQKEVAERLAAASGTKAYGRLSVVTQRRCAVTQHMGIGPDSFQPAPRVDSAVVELRPYPEREDRDFELWLAQIVSAAFSKRRKTLVNTLGPHVSPATLRACNIDPTSRAEQLSVADFVRLAQATRS